MNKIDKYFNYIDVINNKNIFDDKNSVDEILGDLINYTNEYALNNHDEYDDVVIEGDVLIGNDVKIDSFTKIIGPVIIGDNVEISTNVLIRPNTIIGSNVKIGHGSEIKESFIMNDAKVASNVFVGNSIIGYKTRIGSGSILANRRFDQGNIKIKNYDTKEIIETNLDFFGAIVGDESRIGANCNTMPGTLIGHDTFVATGLTVRGFIPSDMFVLNEEYKNLKMTKKDKIELK